jgi:hypothetical protein
MKKLILLGTITLLVSFASKAQYQKGDFLLNAGIGLGYYYAGGVPLIVSGEYAFTDKLTIGPYLGYTSWNNSVFAASYKFRYTFIDFGVRGAYHFSELFGITNEKLDIYGGAFLGYVVSSYTYNGSSSFPTYSDSYGGGVRTGIFAGARYYFAEKVAGYGELGYGISPLSIGLTFKF